MVSSGFWMDEMKGDSPELAIFGFTILCDTIDFGFTLRNSLLELFRDEQPSLLLDERHRLGR